MLASAFAGVVGSCLLASALQVFGWGHASAFGGAAAAASGAGGEGVWRPMGNQKNRKLHSLLS